MSRVAAVLLCTGLLALGLPPLTADDQPQPAVPGVQGAPGMQPQAQFKPDVIRGSEVIGVQVVDQAGKEIGRIEDVVLSPDLKRAAYGVVSFGGLLGIGDKYFAIPCSQFKFAPDHKKVTVNVTKEQLERAQGFDKDKWPDFSDPAWRLQNAQIFGRDELGDIVRPIIPQAVRPGEGERANGPMQMKHRRLSELKSMEVKALRTGEKIGELKHVLFELHRGHVAYGVVSVNGKLAAVPWSALQVRPDEMVVMIDVDRNALEAIAFSDDQWPAFDQAYSVRVHKHFNRQPYWEVFGYVADPRGLRAWGPESPFVRLFNAGKLTTVRGTVESVDTFMPIPGAASGMRLRIKGDDGKSYVVLAGPSQYATDQGFSVRQGEQVSVIGAQVRFNDQDVLIASQLKAGDKTLQLRNEQGQPLWKTNGVQQPAANNSVECP